MPLKAGDSDDTVGDNISEMLDRWARTGKIGSSEPDSKEKAQDQAEAIAMKEARKTTHSCDNFLGGFGGYIQKNVHDAQYAAQEAMARLPIDRLAERVRNAPDALFAASGPKSRRHRKFAGIDCYIENPAGSTRKGTGEDGKKWETTMLHDYGYIRGVDGVDGDELDVFLGPDEDATHVFVIHQRNPVTNLYDEDKVMLGFPDQETALKAYNDNYDLIMPLEGITAVTLEQFKNALSVAENDVFKWKQRMPTIGDLGSSEFSTELYRPSRANRVQTNMDLLAAFAQDEVDLAMRIIANGGML